MKIFYLVLFFTLPVVFATAQKADTPQVNVGSLVRIALADTTRINAAPNKDSLFTKPTGEGTGLGLSLSYDIMVKGHGGKIDVDSQEGEYTEFAVWLPLNKATNA